VFEKVTNFLNKQKQEMLRLDEAEGLRKREESGQDFSLTEKTSGRKVGMREILYNNTIQWIMSESSGMLFPEFFRLSQDGVLNEETLQTNIAAFTTSLLPAVRRIYSRLMAMELVTVQPLTGPSGYLYYIDHLAGATAGEFTANDRLDKAGTGGSPAKTYSDSSEKGTINDVKFQLKKLLISTETKKLKAGWSMEAQQDLASQWKLDVWSELQPAVIDEITREIDRKIIDALVAGVGAGNTNWNANGYLTDDKTTTDRRAYRETLYEAICDSAAKIFKKRYLYPNWLLMNGDTFARLAKLEKFNADPTITPDQQAMIGWRYEGTLAGKYKIFVDPWFTDNKILMGFRGMDWKYACGYYSPYIPIFLSEEYTVNDDFTQRARGAMSRYAYGVLPESDTDPLNYGLATVTITQS
jgi:hypothetical protein